MFHFDQNPTLDYLQRALDGLERRQMVLSNNVANMNTPGFNARDLDFQRVLNDYADAQQREDKDVVPEVTSGLHMGSVLDRIGDAWDNAIVQRNAPPDLQDQMVRLNQTTLQYAAVTQAFSQQLRRYKQVISEGKR